MVVVELGQVVEGTLLVMFDDEGAGINTNQNPVVFNLPCFPRVACSREFVSLFFEGLLDVHYFLWLGLRGTQKWAKNTLSIMLTIS